MLLGLDLTFWHRAIEHIGAGLSTVLGNTQVMFVGLAAWWLYGDRPSRSTRWMVPVILGGVALISGLGRVDTYGEAPLLGVVLGLLTGVTYAAFLLLLRQANRSPAPAVSAMVDATAGACFWSLLVGVFLGTLEWTPHWPAHGWLFAVALGSQVVGWTLINGSLPKLPALEGSILLLLQPVGTVLWGRLLFAEILSTTQWLGVALVVSGIGWLSARGALEKEEDPR
jgi:drug/metabolite transporter (DMT)-like permease